MLSRKTFNNKEQANMATFTGQYVYYLTLENLLETPIEGIFYKGSVPKEAPSLTLREVDESTPDFDPMPGDSLMWGETEAEYYGYYLDSPVFSIVNVYDGIAYKSYYLMTNEPNDRMGLPVWRYQYTDDPLPPTCFVKGTLFHTPTGAKTN